MKRILLIAAAVYLLILLIVPSYIIYHHYDILSTGETFKIEVIAYDPYDPFRGRYVDIRPALSQLRWQHGGIRLIKNADELVVAAETTADTKAIGYVKNLKIERYYMNEKTAPLVEERQMRATIEGDLIYIEIKVKNGNYVVKGLYINGTAAEEYVK